MLKHLTLTVLALTVLTAPASAATSKEIKQVARELVCLCGTCNRESLSTCLCGFATTERDAIGDLLGAGRTRQQIVESYVDRFGPMGLANPPEGYDVVWIVPFVMLGGGIFAVRRVLLNWRGDRRASEAAPHAACPTKPGAYDDRLRRDLDDFEA